MIYPVTSYEVNGHAFKAKLRYKKILHITHLGEDIMLSAGTLVSAVSNGEVVYVKNHPGSAEHRSWGGLIVIKHAGFYSVYGHLYQFQVKVGDTVEEGQVIAQIAPSFTPENGWREHPHLHFGIYTGPWTGQVLPGYWRPTHPFRTSVKYWHAPKAFLDSQK